MIKTTYVTIRQSNDFGKTHMLNTYKQLFDTATWDTEDILISSEVTK